MGLNLNDYEYALPNTITGTVPYGTQTWSAADYFQSEALIIPYGRTYKIEMIRIVNGLNSTSGSLSVGLSRSLEPNVWRTGSGYSNNSFYATYPEVQEAPTQSDSPKQVVYNNTSYYMGYNHSTYNYGTYPTAGRTQFMLWSWQSDGTEGSENWNYATGGRILTKDDGPLWMNSGDAIHMWQGNNPSSSNGYNGTNFKATYVISYIEYF